MSEYLNLPKADYSSNLVAKWVFDDTNTSYVNGTTIYDLSGNGNNLTSANVTYVDDADLGRCAYFNGSASYAQATSTLIPANTFTIIFEIKVIANSAYDYPTIFDTRGMGETKGTICYISGT